MIDSELLKDQVLRQIVVHQNGHSFTIAEALGVPHRDAVATIRALVAQEGLSIDNGMIGSADGVNFVGVFTDQIPKHLKRRFDSA